MRRGLDLLAFAGRYGTQGFALSLLVGLLLPGLAASARPLLGLTIFAFLAITFARADLPAVGRVLRRPGRLAGACAWLVLAPPLLVGAGLALAGRETLDPGLVLGLAPSPRPRRSCRRPPSPSCSGWSRRFSSPRPC
jgi:BASS family bile acid:Na+ symporter